MTTRNTRARSIKKSQESEAEKELNARGYKPEEDKRNKGVPEGFRRFTCVVDIADNQLLHDWAATVRGESYTSVMATAITEYIDNHIRKAADDGLKVRRPNRDSEITRMALEKHADLYEEAESNNDPYARYL